VVNPPATTEDVSGQEKIAASLLRLGLESHALDNEDTTRSLEALSADRWFGTVAYMAPEVLQGEHATRASDIYSFGILTYEGLAARPPFQGAPPEATAAHRPG